MLLSLTILTVGLILVLGLVFLPINPMDGSFDNSIIAMPAPTGPALYVPPTPEPTLAPMPTPEPTLAPTPTPEPTLAPTPTPEPTPVPTPTPEPTLAPPPTPKQAHVGPVPVREALPALLIDAATIIYVIDDSKSMSVNLQSLHDALRELANLDAENSEVAIIGFGGRNRVVFGFTDPSQAPWDSAISALNAAEVGGTNTYSALRAALGLMPEQPTCFDHPDHEQPVCRERRIVLLSDGEAKDPQVAAESLQALVEAGIPVDSIALGTNVDHQQSLREISQVTGGRFIEGY